MQGQNIKLVITLPRFAVRAVSVARVSRSAQNVGRTRKGNQKNEPKRRTDQDDEMWSPRRGGNSDITQAVTVQSRHLERLAPASATVSGAADLAIDRRGDGMSWLLRGEHRGWQGAKGQP